MPRWNVGALALTTQSDVGKQLSDPHLTSTVSLLLQQNFNIGSNGDVAFAWRLNS